MRSTLGSPLIVDPLDTEYQEPPTEGKSRALESAIKNIFVFIRSPRSIKLSAPSTLPIRFETWDAQDLQAKNLSITVASAAGSVYFRWRSLPTTSGTEDLASWLEQGTMLSLDDVDTGSLFQAINDQINNWNEKLEVFSPAPASIPESVMEKHRLLLIKAQEYRKKLGDPIESL